MRHFSEHDLALFLEILKLYLMVLPMFIGFHYRLHFWEVNPPGSASSVGGFGLLLLFLFQEVFWRIRHLLAHFWHFHMLFLLLVLLWRVGGAERSLGWAAAPFEWRGSHCAAFIFIIFISTWPFPRGISPLLHDTRHRPFVPKRPLAPLQPAGVQRAQSLRHRPLQLLEFIRRGRRRLRLQPRGEDEGGQARHRGRKDEIPLAPRSLHWRWGRGFGACHRVFEQLGDSRDPPGGQGCLLWTGGRTDGSQMNFGDKKGQKQLQGKLGANSWSWPSRQRPGWIWASSRNIAPRIWARSGCCGSAPVFSAAGSGVRPNNRSPVPAMTQSAKFKPLDPQNLLNSNH